MNNEHNASISPLAAKNAERAEIEQQLNEWLGNGNEITHVTADRIDGYPTNYNESERGIAKNGK